MKAQSKKRDSEILGEKSIFYTDDFKTPPIISLEKDKEIEMLRHSKDKVLNICKEKVSVPNELSNIVDEINNSKEILDLEYDWDDEGASQIPKEVWQNAVKFLINYSKKLHELDVNIEAPDIEACRDGSIDLSWRTPMARMLINIKMENGKVYAEYYGDLFNNEKSIKGTIPVPEIEDHLLYWMKNLNKNVRLPETRI